MEKATAFIIIISFYFIFYIFLFLFLSAFCHNCGHLWKVPTEVLCGDIIKS